MWSKISSLGMADTYLLGAIFLWFEGLGAEAHWSHLSCSWIHWGRSTLSGLQVKRE